MGDSISAYCYLCGEPEYGNIDGTKSVRCGLCVQRIVKHLERIELQSGMKIKNIEEYGVAVQLSKEHPTPPTRKRCRMPLRGLEREKTVLWATNFKRCPLPVRWDEQ